MRIAPDPAAPVVVLLGVAGRLVEAGVVPPVVEPVVHVEQARHRGLPLHQAGLRAERGIVAQVEHARRRDHGPRVARREPLGVVVVGVGVDVVPLALDGARREPRIPRHVEPVDGDLAGRDERRIAPVGGRAGVRRVIGDGPVGRAQVTGGVGPDAIVEDRVVGQIRAVEQAPVVRGEDVGIGVRARQDFQVEGRHDPVRQGEVDALDAHRRSEPHGGAREIVRAVSPPALPAIDDLGGGEDGAVEIRQRPPDRVRLRPLEPRRLRRRDRARVQVAADGDEAEAPVHHHLGLRAEDVDATDALAQHHHDGAAAHVEHARDHRGRERRRGEPVAGRVRREVSPRRLLRARRRGCRGPLRRGPHRPEEGGHAPLRVPRGDDRRREARRLAGDRGSDGSRIVGVAAGQVLLGARSRRREQRREGHKITKGPREHRPPS